MGPVASCLSQSHRGSPWCCQPSHILFSWLSRTRIGEGQELATDTHITHVTAERHQDRLPGLLSLSSRAGEAVRGPSRWAEGPGGGLTGRLPIKPSILSLGLFLPPPHLSREEGADVLSSWHVLSPETLPAPPSRPLSAPLPSTTTASSPPAHKPHPRVDPPRCWGFRGLHPPRSSSHLCPREEG